MFTPKRQMSGLLLATLILAILAVNGYAQSPSDLSISGKQLNEKFRLSVSHQSIEKGKPTRGNEDGAAGILIWAEPSHTLLMAYWLQPQPTQSLRDQVAAEWPLIEIDGEPGLKGLQALLPYQPTLDSAVVVELVAFDGERRVVSAGRVDLTDFEFSTQLRNGDASKAGGNRHCCSGGNCGTMCETCPDPYFTCDLQACTITCGW